MVGGVAELGLAIAAVIFAAWHDLWFRRTNGDGFRFAQLGKERAEVPETTRQHNAHKAWEAIRIVLLGVHD